MTEGRPLIELKDIRKTFADFRLDGVDLDLHAGEVHVIVGENGSGKSTLMKLISGWFPPDSGVVRFKGEAIGFRSISEAQDNGILYLHQDVQSFPNLSVAENVFFGLHPRLWGVRAFVDPDRLMADCRRVFDELNIPIDPQVPLRSLGYAQRQLTAAARGFIFPADLVIFDEPSSAMGEADRAILFDIVSRLKDRGKGIFYISHRMDEIRRVGDRMTVMHRGRVLATESCHDVSRDSLVHMMTEKIRKERYPRLSAPRGQTVMSVRGLVRSPILKGVNFDVRRGEILGITGLMGSGRTLLANCLFGVVRPDRGVVEIEGRTVNFANPGEAMESGISLIPEDRANYGIFHRHNLIRNITSATLKRFRLRGVLDENFMRSLTREYIRQLSIKPGNTGDIMDTYSGGNQQKVMISRWLMNRTKIYIMDEPTRGVDVASRVDIYNAMNDMVDKGAAIILISSEIEEILGMSDRVLVLAGGRIAAEMDREDASKERILDCATAET